MKKKIRFFNKRNKIFILLILIIQLFFFFYKKANNNIRAKSIKICICTLAKNENRYIKEFTEHYKKYGVDKIYLYDNNDIKGEELEEVINDYVKNGFVEILNWRGKKQSLFKIINNCYQTNYNYYDFLLFFEVDEYIHLYNYVNIKQFLSKKIFNNCEIIYLNLVDHTDNNKLYYEDKPLKERFPQTIPLNKLGGFEIKFILRGHIPNITIYNIHYCNTKMKTCNSFGNSYKSLDIYCNDKPDYQYYYIDHYYSKSTEEFIDKINNKASPIFNTTSFLYNRIYKYLSENEITLQKIEMIEKGTGLQLSKYKKKFLLNKLVNN